MPSIALDETFTMIVVFTTEPSQQEPLIEAICEQVERWVRYCPGFVSATFHRSDDGVRVVNYAQWRTREDWEAFTRHPEQAALMEAIRGVGPGGPDGHGYEVARVFDGPG